MIELIKLCVSFLASTLRSRAALQAENLALRHQLCVYHRSIKRPKVQLADRILWSLLARAWTQWKDALIFVKPDTVIRWQRKRFKEHWKKLSRAGEPGRPPVPEEVKELIRTMSPMNSCCGPPPSAVVTLTVISLAGADSNRRPGHNLLRILIIRVFEKGPVLVVFLLDNLLEVHEMSVNVYMESLSRHSNE